MKKNFKLLTKALMITIILFNFSSGIAENTDKPNFVKIFKQSTDELKAKGFNQNSRANKEILKIASTSSGSLPERIVLDWKNSSYDTTGKEVFTYDQGGILQTRIFYFGTPSTGYVKSQRETYTYNSIGQEKTVLGEIWNGLQWENSFKTVKEYDQNDKEILHVYLSLDGSGNWDTIYGSKTIYTYDVAGNPLTQFKYSLLINVWENTSRTYFNYNTSNELISTVYQQFDVTLGWVDIEKEEYVFTANGHWSEILIYEFDGTWKLAGKITDIIWHDFNEGIMLSYIRQKKLASSFMNVSRFTSTYHSNGELKEGLYEDYQNLNWVNQMRLISTFDIHDNKIEFLVQMWSVNGWKTSSGDKINFIYDANGSMVSEEHAFFDQMGAVWLNVVKYLYKDETTSIEKIKGQSKVKIYPNPFLDYIVIESAEDVKMEIFDITGTMVRKVLSIGTSNAKIDCSNLQNGVYFVRLTGNDGHSITNKIIKN